MASKRALFVVRKRTWLRQSLHTYHRSAVAFEQCSPHPKIQDVMAEAISVESPRRPRGRPPCGCVWMKGCYVNLASGAEDARERFLQRRRLYDRTRYWDPKKNVRKQRLMRSAHKNSRPLKPIQLKLDGFATSKPDAAEQCVHMPGDETGPGIKSSH